MNKVTVAAAKARLSEILASVEQGQDVIITRRGTAVARLTAVERVRHPLRLDAIDAFRATMTPVRTRNAEWLRKQRDEGY